jgi:hypothetical protein
MTVNINTVAENLRNTANMAAAFATIEFLKININELKVILHDVEQCAEQFSLMSWEINPERMGQ